MEAMAEGLSDGTIDVIATDHAPHGQIEKLCTFEEAAMGISTLETALGSVMSLVHAGRLSLPMMVEKLTSAPARFLGRTDIGTLRTGARGRRDGVRSDMPSGRWIRHAFVSKGKNSPLNGATLRGRVVATVVSGEVVCGDKYAVTG